MFSKISTPKETFNFNNTVVNLIPGDITNQKVDVICISNHNFTGFCKTFILLKSLKIYENHLL